MTWEEAVLHLRTTASSHVIKQCYFHENVLEAAHDFYLSEEFAETLNQIGKSNFRDTKILDLGAGNGIASYAFSKLGAKVTAVEPDPSLIVGAGAIRKLNEDLPKKNQIEVVSSFGENLPFEESSFDIVYARQVLHHAHDLVQLVGQATRVLKPGGWLVTIRDHVINNKTDLDSFFKNHLLHKYYGGENAFQLSEYREAFMKSNLHTVKEIGPLSSLINYFPSKEKQIAMKIRGLMKPEWNMLKYYYTRFLSSQKIVEKYGQLASKYFSEPGRLYSFILRKKVQ